MGTKPICLTASQLKKLRPCDLESRLLLFKGRRSLNASQALALGVSIRDLLWVADALGRKDLCVRYASACAQRVAHYNTDPRVQRALDATQNWLNVYHYMTPRSAARAAEDASWAAAARASAGAAEDAAKAAARAAEAAARDAAGGAAARAARAAGAAARAAASCSWGAAQAAAGAAAEAAASCSWAAEDASWATAGGATAQAASWDASCSWCAAQAAELTEQRRIFLEIFGE